MSSLPTSIGRFSVLRTIGRGGMGAVYLAKDPDLGRHVAIKLILEDFGLEDMRARFEREARALANLPPQRNIVTIFEYGEQTGKPYIVMEYVPGETLAEKIRRAEIIAVTEKLNYLEQLCAGLDHAHRAQIVHRDIKPVNIMITPQGGVKILDFGIARLGASTTNLTHLGALIGTFNYMSPEQMQGLPVDARSDIFSVGAVAYELFSYRQAFPGVMPSVYHNVLAVTPPLIDGLDPEISRIIYKALEKDPVRRFPDLGAMGRAAERVARRMTPVAEAQTDIQVEAVTSPTPPQVQVGLFDDRLARVREDEVQRKLDTARLAFERGEVEAAIDACERALVIDPQRRTTWELLERYRQTLEQPGNVWLTNARDALRLQDSERIRELLEQASRLALPNYRPTLRDAIAGQIEHLRVAHERAERESAREAELAAALVERARDLFTLNPDSAIKLLADIPSPHSLVAQTLDAFRAEHEELLSCERALSALADSDRQSRAHPQDSNDTAQIPAPLVGRRDQVEPASGLPVPLAQVQGRPPSVTIPSDGADAATVLVSRAEPKPPPARSRTSRLLMGSLALGTLTAAIVLWVETRVSNPPPSSADRGVTGPSSTIQPTPGETPAQAPATPASGTLVIDAIPWASIVRVTNERGTSESLKEAYTPLAVTLAPGRYAVVLRDSGSNKTETLTVDVLSGIVSRAFTQFKTISVDDYFRDRLPEAGR